MGMLMRSVNVDENYADFIGQLVVTILIISH